MNNIEFQNKPNRTILYLVIFVCVMTNMSQMPAIVQAGYTRFFSVPLWVMLALSCMISLKKIPYYDIKNIFFLFFLFGAYYYIARIINNDYARSALPSPIFMCFFIIFVGYLAGRFFEIRDIDSILTAYVISSSVVCLDVFRTYVFGTDMSALTYSYASKNSVSQILLSCWIIILLRKFGKTTGLIKNVYYIAVFLLLTITMLGLKSRATIIGMPVVIVWILVNGKIDRKIKRIIIPIIIAVVAFLLIKPQYYEMLVNNILFANRSGGSLEDLTSGRYSQWQNFGDEFKDIWMFGKGSAARESLVLTALLEFGVIGGSLIFVLALCPLWWCFRKFNRNNSFYLFFSSIAIVYIMNGVFEQLAPFGPGVKCYLLWFLFGIFLNIHMNWPDDEEQLEV